jgi:hypothetical protein
MRMSAEGVLYVSPLPGAIVFGYTNTVQVMNNVATTGFTDALSKTYTSKVTFYGYTTGSTILTVQVSNGPSGPFYDTDAVKSYTANKPIYIHHETCAPYVRLKSSSLTTTLTIYASTS